MQHNGHSRVVIGVSVRGTPSNRETQLIIFDPATYGPELKHSIARNQRGWHSMVKRGLNTLRKPEYEFVVIEPNIKWNPLRSKCPTGHPT